MSSPNRRPDRPTLLLCLALLLFGCATSSRPGSLSLRIVVLDPGHGAVAGAEVRLNGTAAGITDRSGRLTLPVGSRSASIRVLKPGYESVEAIIEPVGDDELLLVELRSVAGLLELALAALEEGAHAVAVEAAQRAAAVAPQEPAVLAVLALSAERTGDFALARRAARQLVELHDSEAARRLAARLNRDAGDGASR